MTLKTAIRFSQSVSVYHNFRANFKRTHIKERKTKMNSEQDYFKCTHAEKDYIRGPKYGEEEPGLE